MAFIVEVQKEGSGSEFINLEKVSWVQASPQSPEGRAAETRIYFAGCDNPAVVLTGGQAESFLRVYRDYAGALGNGLRILPPVPPSIS